MKLLNGLKSNWTDQAAPASSSWEPGEGRMGWGWRFTGFLPLATSVLKTPVSFAPWQYRSLGGLPEAQRLLIENTGRVEA